MIRRGHYADLPDCPSMTSDGSYYKPELKAYFDQCKDRQIPMHRIADHLDVPLDRVIYALGEWYQYIFRGMST